jgi:hypothetical protein
MIARPALLVVMLLAACWRSKPPPRQSPPEPIHPVKARSPVPGKPGDLYALDEALADALSGKWTFVGTGEWFGMFRINACVYRNERVYIVNVYCTRREMRSFGVVILSPTRGRVKIYAEGAKVPTASKVADWSTFKAESTLPTDEPAHMDFTYAELRAWDERRYYKHSAGCWLGTEINRPHHGCLKVPEREAEWTARNKDFFSDSNAHWFRMIKEIRALAVRDARPYKDP